MRANEHQAARPPRLAGMQAHLARLWEFRPAAVVSVVVAACFATGVAVALVTEWATFAVRQPILGVLPSGGPIAVVANAALLVAFGWFALDAAVRRGSPTGQRVALGITASLACYWGARVTELRLDTVQWVALAATVWLGVKHYLRSKGGGPHVA